MPAAPGQREAVDDDNKEDYMVASLTGRMYHASKVVTSETSGNNQSSQSQASLDMHGDSNSESEILDQEFRRNGIRRDMTFKVESGRKR